MKLYHAKITCLKAAGTAQPEMWIPIPDEEIYAGEFKVNHSLYT